jgi:hypothetical protein
MGRAAPSSRFSVQLTYENTHRFLHLIVDRCRLRSTEEVTAFYGHCYTRIRTFELPADMIIRYDHFDVSDEAVHAFAVQRTQWAERLGGGLYRYAGADESRQKLSVSSLPSRPDQTPFAVFATFDAAVRQLLADRERKWRPPFAILQRQADQLRAGLAHPAAAQTGRRPR